MKHICLLIFIGLSFLTSVSAQKNISVISLVPEKSVAVLRVDWTKVRGNGKLKQVVNGDSFSNIGSLIGVSEEKISEWVIFSDINPTSSKGMGMIVAGNFTLQSIAQFARSKDWRSEKIGAQTAFVNPTDNSYLLPIRNGLLAAGSKSGIEKVSKVLSRQGKNLISNAPFDSMWSEIRAKSFPINFMVGVPEEYKMVADIAYKVAAKLMNLASFGIIGTVMETIGFVNCFGFNISHRETVFPTQILAMMDSETKAWIASGAVNLLKKAPNAVGMQAKTEEDRQFLESVQTMSATYKKTLLTVNFEMPERLMEKR